jgi:hypothetical protein
VQFIAIGVLTALSVLLTMGPTANAAGFDSESILVGVVDMTPSGSLAWSGEIESFSSLHDSVADTELVESEGTVDVALMTPLAAPEPPAIVLAGMALAGLIGSRSLLQKRRKATKETI